MQVHTEQQSKCSIVGYVKNALFLTYFCLVSLVLTGCLKDTSEDVATASSFQGCVSGEGIGAGSIRINFEFPDNVSRMTIYRNGQTAYTSLARSITTFVDTGLREAGTYEYMCEGILDGKETLGIKSLSLSTLSSNPPIFAGITSASALSARSAKLIWPLAPASGPAVATFKIYANPGASVDWNASPRMILDADLTTLDLTTLGDELPYAFGVRACTIYDVCDSNTVERNITLSDGGIPLTSGASHATASNGEVKLYAPWVEQNGAVKKRYVYKKVGGTSSTTIGDYVLEQTIAVTNLANPLQEIIIPGILDNTTYHFIVRDEDPSGANNLNTNVVSISTGDLTPPVFSGILTLVNGTPSETVLTAGFTAIADANNYIVLKTQSAYPAIPANPCTSGTIHSTLTAASYPPGARTVDLTGLAPRTNYSICIKAQDLSGNTSTNTNFITQNTLDTTAPLFDGIQTLTFNTSDSKIYANWNSSPSSDIHQYKIKLWKNTTSPNPGDITEITYLHSSYPTTVSFSRPTPFLFNNLDVVYAVVDACDDWASGNCTSKALSSAKVLTLPEFVPPEGFPGIRPAAFQSSVVEGQILINWYEPAAWTPDFAGFKVYTIDTATSALTLRKTCPCATPGSCNAGDVVCTLTGIPNAGRTYRWHVRAYNSGGFDAVLDPTNAAYYADKKMADTTAPSFSSGLNISSNFLIGWSAATDNQFSEMSNSLYYKVYRKAAATFSTPTNPSADGTLIQTVANSTSYQDSGLGPGVTYYYSVCASDQAGNTTCDGNVQSRTAVDTTPPVIGFFSTDKTAPMKRWTLNWSMSDTGTAAGSLQVEILKKITTTSTQPANWSQGDEVIVLSNVGLTTHANEVGPINLDRYVHYRLKVVDNNGNSSYAHTFVHSTNTMTITSISKAYGTTAGGKTIIIYGTGFSKAANNGFGVSSIAKMGKPTTVSCANSAVATDTIMTCSANAGAVGFVNIEISNPDGSSAIFNDGYEYRTISLDICDNPGTWGPEMAAGTGSNGDPFIICSIAHLDNLRKNVADGMAYNYRTGGYYFKLGDHIDLSGGFSPISTMYLYLDGDDYSLLNWTYSESTGTALGLFRNNTTETSIRNIKLINFNLETTTSSNVHVGLLIGQARNMALENIYVTGSLNVPNAYSSTGGLVGYIIDVANTIKDVQAEVIIKTKTGGAGGTAGGLAGGSASRLEITNAHLLANSEIGRSYMAGGLVGNAQNELKVSKSSVKGVVGDLNSGFVGGIFGYISALGYPITINESFVEASLTGNIATNGIGHYNMHAATVAAINDVYIKSSSIMGNNRYGLGTGIGLTLNMDNVLSLSPLPINAPTCGFYVGPGSVNANGAYHDSTACLTNGSSSTVGKTTSELQNPASIFWSGFDFTPVTGKWKWCGANDYPHLMWEACP